MWKRTRRKKTRNGPSFLPPGTAVRAGCTPRPSPAHPHLTLTGGVPTRSETGAQKAFQKECKKMGETKICTETEKKTLLPILAEHRLSNTHLCAQVCQKSAKGTAEPHSASSQAPAALKPRRHRSDL